MTNYEKVYWLTRLDSLHGLFLAILVLSCLFVGGKLFLKILDSGCGVIVFTPYKWINRIFVPLMIIGALGASFLPTQKEALLIIAGGKTIDYIQSDTSLSKIPYQTTAIISEFMDNQLKELKKKD